MFEIIDAPKAPQAACSDQTFTLAEYPAHRFTESGIPIRVSLAKRGKRAPLGEEPSVRTKGEEVWYRIPHVSGTHRVVSRTTIREKLFGFKTNDLPLRDIEDFPNNRFDEHGGCYRRSNSKPVAYTETNLMGEKRYRVWSKSKQAYAHITNVTIVRLLDNRCSLEYGAKLPEDYKTHHEYPGYGFHPSGDSVVRYASYTRQVSAPREIAFTNDWSVVIYHLDGHKVRLNKRQIAELAGNDQSEYAPEPEPISVCPAFFAPSDNPRDRLLPQHQPQYDAEMARQKELGQKPVWPPHLR